MSWKYHLNPRGLFLKVIDDFGEDEKAVWRKLDGKMQEKKTPMLKCDFSIAAM